MSLSASKTTVAYFSMEIALDTAIPTYSGGLGVLAGDTLRSAADLALPLVGISLLHRKGYFEQHLDGAGNQSESAVQWNPEQVLEAVDATASVQIEGRTVRLGSHEAVVATDNPPTRGHSAAVLVLERLDDMEFEIVNPCLEVLHPGLKCFAAHDVLTARGDDEILVH